MTDNPIGAVATATPLYPADDVQAFLVGEAVDRRRALVPLPLIVESTSYDRPTVDMALVQLDREGLARVWTPNVRMGPCATISAFVASLHNLRLHGTEWIDMSRKGRRDRFRGDRFLARAAEHYSRVDEGDVVDSRTLSPDETVMARESAPPIVWRRKCSDKELTGPDPTQTVVMTGDEQWEAADYKPDQYEARHRAWLDAVREAEREEDPAARAAKRSLIPRAPKARSPAGCPVCGDAPKAEGHYCARCDKGGPGLEWLMARRLGERPPAEALPMVPGVISAAS